MIYNFARVRDSENNQGQTWHSQTLSPKKQLNRKSFDIAILFGLSDMYQAN